MKPRVYSTILAVVWLVICGILLQWSVAMYKSIVYNIPILTFASNSFLRLFAGFVAFIAGVWIFNRNLGRYADTIYYLAIFILIITLAFGKAFGGATRWVSLLGFSFQPSEIVKFMFVIYLAKLYAYEGNGKAYRIFWKTIITGFVIAILIALQPNISTATAFMACVLLILWFMGARISQVLISILLFLTAFYLAYATFPHVRERIDIFMGGSQQTTKMAQVLQSKVAMVSGGLFGKGPGQGLQKLGYLPSSDKDFAFSYISEEYGMLGFPAGNLWIMLMIFIITWNGIWAASKVKDNFRKCVIFGFSLMFFIFSFVHIMVNLGILPPTGLTLPFVSYGGSSMIANSFIAGYILRGIVFTSSTRS